MDEKNISEEILSHRNSAEVVDNKCDDNRKNHEIQKKKQMSH